MIIKILSSLKSNIVFNKLLKYGLFSEKISEIFSSESFGKWARTNDIKNHIACSFSLVTYRLTRNNNAPRLISIPHPIAYYRLCKTLKTYWIKLVNIIGEIDDYDTRSMIIPKPNNLNKRLVSMVSYDKRKDEKFLILDKSFRKKYLVRADISNCYPSIYSHAVPWAVAGHSVAKANIGDKSKWYNKIDFAIRSMQRNETMGIPIGPDTSSVISELVLSRIDKAPKKYNYLRFIDDYKCFCRSMEEADEFLRNLSKELEKYHLSLNTKKTKIIELPTSIDEDWVRRLKTYSNINLNEAELTNKHTNKICDFLDLAIEYAKENPGESSLKYAVRILSKKQFKDKDVFLLTIIYLSRICFIYPYFIDVFDNLIQNNKKMVDAEVLQLLQKELNSLAKEHLKYSRADVALWGIYLAVKYGFQITSFDLYSDKIINDRDCLPALLCYFYSKANKLKTSKYFSLVGEIISENLEDEWWIYIYELYYDKPGNPFLKGIKYKSFYAKLRLGKVSFIKFRKKK